VGDPPHTDERPGLKKEDAPHKKVPNPEIKNPSPDEK
jgi:hypothetical protein